MTIKIPEANIYLITLTSKNQVDMSHYGPFDGIFPVSSKSKTPFTKTSDGWTCGESAINNHYNWANGLRAQIVPGEVITIAATLTPERYAWQAETLPKGIEEITYTDLNKYVTIDECQIGEDTLTVRYTTSEEMVYPVTIGADSKYPITGYICLNDHTCVPVIYGDSDPITRNTVQMVVGTGNGYEGVGFPIDQYPVNVRYEKLLELFLHPKFDPNRHLHSHYLNTNLINHKHTEPQHKSAQLIQVKGISTCIWHDPSRGIRIPIKPNPRYLKRCVSFGGITHLKVTGIEEEILNSSSFPSHGNAMVNTLSKK